MHNYTTIIGVIGLRLDQESYDTVQEFSCSGNGQST